MTFFDETDLQFYKQQGYFLSNLPIINGKDLESFRHLCSQLVNEKIGKNDRAFIDDLHIKYGDFLHYALRDDLLDLVEMVIGPDFGLAWSAALVKNKKSNVAFSWHSDFNEGQFSETLKDHPFLSLILASSDATLESGCLQYLPGSHLAQSKKSETELSLQQECGTKLAEVKAGHFILHHPHTLHCSEKNSSDQHRILINFWYVSTDVSSLDKEAISFLKNKSPGRVHLRGSDLQKICAHSVTDYL